jgi:transcriptional regulator with XRE-family HTH domain
MTLGGELREARRTAGLTQEQLAVAAKVDRTYISELENDHQSPTIDMLCRLCKSLGVLPSVLLARVEATQGISSRTDTTST